MEAGQIVSVAISEIPNTTKKTIEVGKLIKDRSLEGDNPGSVIRQLSIIAFSDVQALIHRQGIHPQPGDFGENVMLTGFSLKTLKVGQELYLSDGLLEVVQLGCEVSPQTHTFKGFRILPAHGVFCRILCDGTIKPGDKISVHPF